MELQTKIPIEKAENQIDYHSRIVLVGSCFVENIGDKLDYFKFRSLRNPFGILFHPLAIEKLMECAIKENIYHESEVFGHHGIWHCFDAHSSLSNTSKKELLNNLDNALKETKKALENASHIVITLGTAWVYRYNMSQRVVANCHKVPQKEFTKELLTLDDISSSLHRLITLIRTINSKAEVIFTVSPVRHLKDGFVENQRSKSQLISGLHTLFSSDSEREGLSYFPSYEIMMDELRDYRFYAKDMIHPNELAIDYIWERFKSIWISSPSHEIMDEIDGIQRGLAHKPFNPDSKEHLQFKKSLDIKITYLKKKYPFLDF